MEEETDLDWADRMSREIDSEDRVNTGEMSD